MPWFAKMNWPQKNLQRQHSHSNPNPNLGTAEKAVTIHKEMVLGNCYRIILSHWRQEAIRARFALTYRQPVIP
jgi:hypothetical protein